MNKQSDNNTEIMKRLQNMQKEQLIISVFNKALSKILDKKQFQLVLNQFLKSEIKFDELVILSIDENNNESEIFHHTFINNSLQNKGSKLIDSQLDKCLKSAEPIFFDLKNSIPFYFLDSKNVGMRTAIGFCLPLIQEKTNIIFFFYKDYIQIDEKLERILAGISTQLSITIRNIILTEKFENLKVSSSNFQDENKEIQPIKSQNDFYGIIGNSEPMLKIYEKISQVAPSESNVLIYGETGTGKELAAQAIHDLSSSAHKKMVRINCAAIPANLIESELFGHEKGSFTGATEQRTGKFEQANNSTIFLDEIGELPLELQGRLLRVLQEKEIERIGGNKRIKVNVRIIAATNRNLEKEVVEGNFRSDLFYRLNVFPIHLPALRDRKEDIPLLANYFLEKHHLKTGKKIKGFSQKVINEMYGNPWPGNIRELENMIERSMLTAKENIIKEIEFSKSISLQNKDQEFQIKTLQQMEKEYILKVVEKCSGRISGKQGAAVLLGLPATTLISKMQKLGIKKGHYFKEKE
ncbi:formate hydrogenlyase transcriptional activator [Chryseobacterium ginsenosidimutans]|uniref:sigma-54 interaction domain-containing protein n=1 Tax=Chryseobacterium ginsenosidimutans TaxID=687846 RepID=UPI00278694AF|nr:sigma 54-interacting transcriptional regulator [Chryseobacterium ginsenosidimutans]MDQ0594283.1 formate hydrogenlyase transcriptional activator [Chryseobacterium ginsenosidimutans]